MFGKNKNKTCRIRIKRLLPRAKDAAWDSTPILTAAVKLFLLALCSVLVRVKKGKRKEDARSGFPTGNLSPAVPPLELNELPSNPPPLNPPRFLSTL